MAEKKNETVENEVQVKNEPKPKKSKLLADHKKLSEKAEKIAGELQKKEYEIKFGDKKIYKEFVKFIEKDAPWGHTTAAGLIMLYRNLIEQKSIVNDKDWDGIIKLRAANASIFWQMLTKMTGTGFFEARRFVELMAAVGEDISTVVRSIQEESQGLRDIHTEIAKIDNVMESGEYENDTNEEDTRYKTADEVNPEV